MDSLYQAVSPSPRSSAESTPREDTDVIPVTSCMCDYFFDKGGYKTAHDITKTNEGCPRRIRTLCMKEMDDYSDGKYVALVRKPKINGTYVESPQKMWKDIKDEIDNQLELFGKVNVNETPLALDIPAIPLALDIPAIILKFTDTPLKFITKDKYASELALDQDMIARLEKVILIMKKVEPPYNLTYDAIYNLATRLLKNGYFIHDFKDGNIGNLNNNAIFLDCDPKFQINIDITNKHVKQKLGNLRKFMMLIYTVAFLTDLIIVNNNIIPASALTPDIMRLQNILKGVRLIFPTKGSIEDAIYAAVGVTPGGVIPVVGTPVSQNAYTPIRQLLYYTPLQLFPMDKLVYTETEFKTKKIKNVTIKDLIDIRNNGINATPEDKRFVCESMPFIIQTLLNLELKPVIEHIPRPMQQAMVQLIEPSLSESNGGSRKRSKKSRNKKTTNKPKNKSRRKHKKTLKRKLNRR